MEKLKPKIDIYAGHGRDLKMEEQGLCFKCVAYLKDKWGDQYYITPFSHCHHPDPEPPPCKWCEEWKGLKLTWHDTPFWRSLNYLINASDKPIDECPVCGGEIMNGEIT